jgi:hypothetical protein
MKNYLVRSLYQIDKGVLHIAPADYCTYKEMHEYTLTSFNQFIAGPWDPILFTGTVDNVQEMFKDVFLRTYNLWHQEECNILFVDLDIVAVKPVSIFDQYQNFTMFFRLLDQFNCGLRYFPASMSKSIWEYGLTLYNEWNNDCEWDREQTIYSKMCVSQEDFVTVTTPIIAQGNISAFNDSEYRSQHPLLHLHSSHIGPSKALDLIKNFYSEIKQ